MSQPTNIGPVGWRYKVIINKHSTGPQLDGEIAMWDISGVVVFGKPGAWKYSDGPEKPDVDWMCEVEPLFMGTIDAAIERERNPKL